MIRTISGCTKKKPDENALMLMNNNSYKS